MFSHREEVDHYLSRRRWRRAVCGVAFIVLGLIYLGWRITIFNPEAPVFSVLFFLAELLMFLSGVSLIYGGWHGGKSRAESEPSRQWTVDVLVPVFSEPEEMIELTLLAAQRMEYPHRTWLLDDGDRPELERLARHLGVGYLCRKNRQGAKAGNLNHGLRHTTGELVAVFDADHIARPDALDRLSGFFRDPQVGMAQAPQTYYNEDAIVFRPRLCGVSPWHEQSFFYDVQQTSRDRWGAASGVGTGCVFRRQALEQIGGFPEETLTEDFHVSLKLLKAGWKCPYLNEPVAWGVAAADVSEFFKTRHRWYYGNIQVLALERILWCRGLTVRQRMAYLTMGTQYLDGWAQLLFLFLPPYSLVSLQIPFVLSYANLAWVLGAPMVLMLLMSGFGAGYLPFLTGQVFAVGRMPMALRAWLGLSGRKLPWAVSRKNVQAEVDWRLIWPMIMVLAFSLLALVFAAVQWMNERASIPGEDLIPGFGYREIALFVGFYVLLNIWKVGVWLWNVVRLSRCTHRSYLFPLQVPVLDDKGEWVATTQRLGQDKMELGKRGTAGEALARAPWRLILPCGELTVHARHESHALFALETAPPTRQRLRQSLYAVDWHRMIRLAPYSFRAEQNGISGPWYPALLRQSGHGTSNWAMAQLRDGQIRPERILAAADLDQAQEFELRWERDGQIQSCPVRVTAQQHILPSIPADLNGVSLFYYLIDNVCGTVKSASHEQIVR